MEYKNCFVPSCSNDTVNSPDKLFVKIRQDLRKQWCKATNTDYRLYTIYCCEDHFDITKPQPAIAPVKSNFALTTLKKVSKKTELEQLNLQPTVQDNQRLLSLRKRRNNISGTSNTLPKRVNTAMNEFKKACRCCLLNVGPMKPIFGSSLDVMLSELMGFQIEKNDGYPQQICTRCVRKLSSAYNFYQAVNKSHQTVEEKCKVPNKVSTKESYADYAIIGPEYRDLQSATKVSVACQTEEKDFQKLMLANVQLSRIERDSSNEMDYEEYVIEELPENRVEDCTVVTQENETFDELPDTKYTYKCSQCLYVSDSHDDLKKHVATHVAGAAGDADEYTTPTELCNICGQTFKLRTSLYKHLRFHSGLIFECKYCDKQFAEQSTLKVHLITHSLKNSKPFDCESCERSFTQKSALTKHQRAMHAAVRPVLRCKQCNHTFLYKLSLKKHCLRHHSKTSCNICDAEFHGIKALEAHLKTHKQSKAFIYEDAEYLEFDEL